MSFEDYEGFDAFSDAYAVGWAGLSASQVKTLTGRRGGKALALGNFTAGNQSDTTLLSRAYINGGSQIVLGAALKWVGAPSFGIYIMGALADRTKCHGSVIISGDGSTISAIDSTGTTVGTYSTDFSDFHYVEIVLNTAGTLKVYLDEFLILDLIGDFSYNSESIGYFGYRSYSTMLPDECYLIDDWYVDTDTRRGDLAILYFPPEADVLNDFTPSTGTDNYACVDELDMDTSDYTESAVVGDEELFSSTIDLSSFAGDVLSVDILGYVNVPDGGVGSGLIPKVKLGGTVYEGTQVEGVTITKSLERGSFAVNPATGTAFTLAEIEAIEAFGWEIGA